MKKEYTLFSNENLRSLIEGKFTKTGIEEVFFMPRTIWHLYLKLDIEHKFENAANKKDASRFLRNVGRAAEVCDRVAAEKGGLLVEAQGSMIHLILPSHLDFGELNDFASNLHESLKLVFSRSSTVHSWRMSADCGMTIVCLLYTSPSPRD